MTATKSKNLRPLSSNEENVNFVSRLFSTHSELVIACTIIACIIIVCVLVFVAKKKQKRVEIFRFICTKFNIKW